jgi:hypothetical protein
MKTLYSLSICIYHSSGFANLIAADNMQKLTDKQIADAITSLERQSLIRWLIGEMNPMKKRLSVYLEEINQMVGYLGQYLF